MSIDGIPAERLRAYLRDLPAGARALLAAELERGLLRGDQIPSAEFILQELRAVMRRVASPPVRIGDPARLFYRPTEPFLIDRQLQGAALPGRIARNGLGALWEWISRDLTPREAKSYVDDATATLTAGDADAADALARTFQVHAAQALGDLIAAAEIDDKLRRRVIGQIGTPQAIQDIRILFAILRHQEALGQLGTRLPGHIGNLADEQLENVAALLQPSARLTGEQLLLSLVVVRNRLAACWQLIRLAIRSADTDVASHIIHAPLAPAVTLALAEVRYAIAQLRLHIKADRITDCVVLLKEIHDSVRGIRTEIELGETTWSRELAALRADVSDVLRTEIEGMPGRMRRLLRPRPVAEIAAGSTLDPDEVAETEARLELVAACRNYASELAINQIASSTYSGLQSQLETGNSALLDTLRAAGDSDRRYRQSQIDAAVRFSTKLLGAEYASLLAKAAASAAGARKILAET